MSQEKIIELDPNTTSTVDFLSKSNLNDPRLAETNDSIDISMQLSDNLDCSSKLILNKNDDLLAFYNRPTMNNSEYFTYENHFLYIYISLIQYLKNQQIVLDQMMKLIFIT